MNKLLDALCANRTVKPLDSLSSSRGSGRAFQQLGKRGQRTQEQAIDQENFIQLIMDDKEVVQLSYLVPV
jgi:hypothetical protein